MNTIALHMRKIKLGAAALPLLLGACAYTADTAGPPREAPYTISLPVQNGETSDGNVEVFSLDGNGQEALISAPLAADMNPAGAPSQENAAPETVRAESLQSSENIEVAMPLAPAGGGEIMPVSGGSVEIFPLDEAMAGVVSPQYRPAKGFAETAAPAAYAAAGPTMGVVYFAHDSARLNASDLRLLDDVAAKARAGRLIAVDGHASARVGGADEVQRRIINLRVSMDRAYAVARALMERGVASANITVRAYGDTRPAGDEKHDRRVELVEISVR